MISFTGGFSSSGFTGGKKAMASSASPLGPDSREGRDQRLFESIAAGYCRKDLVPASRLARRHRLQQTLAALPPLAGPALLEVGCGAGFAAAYLAGYYGAYVGIDYAAPLIAYARQHNQGPGVTFEVSNIKSYQSPRQFDVVLLIGVLHHIDPLEEALPAMVTLLKPGGWLVANEPHPGNPLIRLARGVRKRLDPHYARDQQELAAAELHRLYRQAGLVEIRLVAQGLLSTPFAEVIVPVQAIMQRLAALACAMDAGLERRLGRWLHPFTWNVIAAGRKPQ
jgi:2-polyprenyl-3-methyl-5-hydroxy-6-metoxy-1,4-benzoquinol methylase